MPVVLLIVGLVLTVVGLLTLGFGIPIKEFSFGNTLIVAGALGLGAGIIVMALAFALRELRRIADLLEQRPVVQARPSASGMPAAPPGPPLDLREAQLPRAPAEPPLAPSASPYGVPEPRVPERVLSGGGDRFESERETARATPSSMSPAVPPSSPPSPPPWASEARRSPQPAPLPSTPSPLHAPAPAEEEADESDAPERPSLAERFGFPSRRDAKRPVDWKRASEPAAPGAEPPQRDFDMLWPASRSGERAGPQPMPPAPSPASPAPVAMPPDEPDMPAPQAVSVLKSGAVDGMNYTLYSDGSIEAQLPEGTVRFSSIDDLRAHLDQRDGR